MFYGKKELIYVHCFTYINDTPTRVTQGKIFVTFICNVVQNCVRTELDTFHGKKEFIYLHCFAYIWNNT